MPIYISRGRFTSDAVKGMLAKPENREEAVASAASRSWNTVLHIGCGTGYYSAVLAQLIGLSGKVIAYEIERISASSSR